MNIDLGELDKILMTGSYLLENKSNFKNWKIEIRHRHLKF